MKFTVTSAHLNAAIKARDNGKYLLKTCPVALSLIEKLPGERIYVSKRRACIGIKTVSCTKTMKAIIGMFDEGAYEALKKKLPLSFVLLDL